jgi:hypothetical protein
LSSRLQENRKRKKDIDKEKVENFLEKHDEALEKQEQKTEIEKRLQPILTMLQVEEHLGPTAKVASLTIPVLGKYLSDKFPGWTRGSKNKELLVDEMLALTRNETPPSVIAMEEQEIFRACEQEIKEIDVTHVTHRVYTYAH